MKNTEGTCFDGVKNNREQGIDCGGNCKACAAPVQDKKVSPPRADDQDALHPRNPETGPTDDESLPRDEMSPPADDTASNPSPQPPPQANIPSEKPSWEILNEIHDLALQDAEAALAQCAKVTKKETRDSCYLDIAEITKNKGNCKLIASEESQDGCYATVAQLTKDSGICASIQYADLKDSCYMDFILEGDHALCDFITTEYYKNACAILRS